MKENFWWQVEAAFIKLGLLARGKEKWGERLTRKERKKALDWLAEKAEESNEYTDLYVPVQGYNFNGLSFLQLWNYGNAVVKRLVFHPGFDYNVGNGFDDYKNPIRCMADGIVTYIGYANGWGWHMYVMHQINHKKYGKIKVWSHYAHLYGRPPVSVNSEVKGGQVIARVGNSGTKSPHLHFEIRKRPLGVNFFPVGKNKEFVRANYYDPIEFIEG